MPANCIVQPLILRVIACASILFASPKTFLAQTTGARPRSADSLMYYYDDIKFNLRAPDMIASLKREQQWDKLRNFLENWADSPYPCAELIYPLHALLDIQTGQPEAALVDCNMFHYLNRFHALLDQLNAHPQKYRYTIRINADRVLTYDYSAGSAALILLTRAWAAELLKTGDLSPTARLICASITGNIADPRNWYYRHERTLPLIKEMETTLYAYKEKDFLDAREGTHASVGLLAGIWQPVGRFSWSGTHASAGWYAGIRNNRNEYDAIMDFHFLRTAHDYIINRDDSALSQHYFFGGYLGLEYTRYLIHRRKIDLGVTGGVGWDAMDVANGNFKSDSTINYSPTELSSWSFNGGLKLKYFFKRSTFIGLAVKYNIVNYPNPGGTRLGTGVLSIDLIYGSH